MSRTQDLVVARLRLVARRWQDGAGPLPWEVDAQGAWDGAAGHGPARPGAGPQGAEPDGDDLVGGGLDADDLVGGGLDSEGLDSEGLVGGGLDSGGLDSGGLDSGGLDSGGLDSGDLDSQGLLGAEPAGPAWPQAGMWLRLLGLLVAIVAIGATGLFVSSRPRAAAVDPVVAVAGSAESADPFAEPLGPGIE
ncbi:MAG: hypothetical protein WCF36_08305, partial [Candidatus Nanopelagicales bacterium]